MKKAIYFLALLATVVSSSCKKQERNPDDKREYFIYNMNTNESYSRVYVNDSEVDGGSPYTIDCWKGDKVKVQVEKVPGNVVGWLWIEISTPDAFYGVKTVYTSTKTKSSFTYTFTAP